MSWSDKPNSSNTAEGFANPTPQWEREFLKRFVGNFDLGVYEGTRNLDGKPREGSKDIIAFIRDLLAQVPEGALYSTNDVIEMVKSGKAEARNAFAEQLKYKLNAYHIDKIWTVIGDIDNLLAADESKEGLDG